jgi:hypothetical protein
MRVFILMLCAACVLCACQPAASTGVENRLVAHARSEAASADCRTFGYARQAARWSNIDGLEARVTTAGQGTACAVEFSLALEADPVLRVLNAFLEGTDRLNWAYTGLYGLFDPAARRGRAAFDRLDPLCRRYALEGAGPWPEVVEAYLADPGAGAASAARRAGRDLAACADAFEAAAAAHESAGEPAWSAYWRANAAALPAGAGERVLRAGLAWADAEEDAEIADWFRSSLGWAVTERIELADFEALERFAADPAGLPGLTDSVNARNLQAAAALAQAAGWTVSDDWRPADVDIWTLVFDVRRVLEGWLMSGALKGVDAPPVFAALARACKAGDTLEDYASPFPYRAAGIDGTSASPPCLRAAAAVFAEIGDEQARTAVLAHDLRGLDAVDGVDPDLLAIMAQTDRDQLAGAALIAHLEALDFGPYGCYEPGPALQPYWAAAAPTASSEQCRRLMEGAPDIGDPAAISAVIPFKACSPAGLAVGEWAALRAAQYAAQAGDPDAFACFAEAAALDADPEMELPAAAELLTFVYAGVRLGHLSEDAWIAAGGPHTYSPDFLPVRAGWTFGDAPGWADGPDPLAADAASTNRDPGRPDR